MTTIIVPDLHGDMDEFINILYKFGILETLSIEYIKEIIIKNSYSKLNMKDKMLIQLGDILDSKCRSGTSDNLKYTDMLLFIFLVNMKKNFPNNVVLIIGNHEYLNYNKIFNGVSKYSHRNEKEIDYIKNSIKSYFQYFYIDKYLNLYIHSSIPDNISGVSCLIDIDGILKKDNFRDFTNVAIRDHTFSSTYHHVFTRDVPSLDKLALLGVNRVFMGHTPYLEIQCYNNKIYYCDVRISKSFDVLKPYFEIMSIDNYNNLEVTKISRFNLQ